MVSLRMSGLCTIVAQNIRTRAYAVFADVQTVKGATGSVNQAAKDAYNGAPNAAHVRPRLMFPTSALQCT